MTIKMIGAILLVAGCGSIGFLIANAYKHEINTLREFIYTLERMKNELQFRFTPLPKLCRQISEGEHGCLGHFYQLLAEELESQVRPDAESCVKAALTKSRNIPLYTQRMVNVLGRTLGRFDLSGQLSELDSLCGECSQKLNALVTDQEKRIRIYQTLGLCAGVTMAIVLI